MTGSAVRQTRTQVLRFLLVGGVNTLLTGGIFLVLSSILVPALAYSVAFAIGIALAVAITPRVVFRARASHSQRFRYLAWYLSVYAVGLGVVYLLHDKLMLGNTMVAIVTLVTTAGLSFLGARVRFDQRSERAGEPHG